MPYARLRGWLLTAALVIALLGPALGPGYVLTYDMVFVPQQSFLPAAFGLGEVLPRAVPQDAVLAFLTLFLPGAFWQHLMLVGVVAGAATGVARLLRSEPAWQRVFGALLYVWSAYVVERLVLGSWPLLVAYAVMPWALWHALAYRRGVPGAGARLVLLTALGSLAPSAGLLTLVVSLPIAVGPRSHRSVGGRCLVAAGALAVQFPWLVAALTSPVAGSADPDGALAFQLRAEGSWGSIVTALGTGGVWNSDVIPASRTAGLGLVGTVVVCLLAVAGAPALQRVVGRSGTAVLAITGLGGLLVALTPIAGVLESAPGAGLLRDGHKWLAPLALLLALAAPLGAGRAARRISEPVSRRVLVAALIALPVIVMPDALWGVSGRLSAVQWPSDWHMVRGLVSDRPADTAVLPWGTFRSFDWNDRRTQLDPAPRWLPVTTVVDDRLLVGTRQGVVDVSGESARGAEIRRSIEQGDPLLPVLQGQGVGLVLVEKGTPGVVPELAGLSLIFDGKQLALYEVPGPAAPPAPAPWRVLAISLAWVLAVLALVISALATSRLRLARMYGERRISVVG